MADRERLIQRYADLLEPDADTELLLVVASLDEAAGPYRQLDAPAGLDQAIEELATQRRAPAVNGKLPESIEREASAAPGTPSRLPMRLRTGWFRQGLGMVAAAAVLILVGGILAVTFRNQGGSQHGGLGGVATATANDPALIALQSQAGFQLYAPTWLPSGWTRLPIEQPTRYSGNAGNTTEILLKYSDAGHTQNIGIFEISPPDQPSLPQDNIYQKSQPLDLGQGRTGGIYQQADSIWLWWQQGNVWIQFQTGLAGPQATPAGLVTQDEVIRMAKSMVPVAKAAAQSTATTSAGLPMTVTANGVAVTLESVQVGGNSTRIDFSVPVPSDLTAAHGSNVIAFNPTKDLKINGATLSPSGWTSAGIAPHVQGETTTSFWCVLGSKIDPTQSLTVTLQQFFWVPKPGTTQMVPGPWTFNVTPTMLADHVLPTPNSQGYYEKITVAQAQQLVDFPIVEPSPLPDILTHPEFNTTVSTVNVGVTTRPNLLMLIYSLKENSGKAVNLEETTVESAVPTLENGGIRSVALDGTPSVMRFDQASQITLLIDGVDVTKISGTRSGINVAYFTWKAIGIYYAMWTPTDSQLTGSLLQGMVASMTAQTGALPPRTAVSTASSSASTNWPLSQANNVWSQIVQTVGTDIEPILEPSQLPSSFTSIRLTGIFQGNSANAPSFQVEYDGKSVELLFGVGHWISRPECGSGSNCTESKITVRGQTATLQFWQPTSSTPAHADLTWNEPGIWAGGLPQSSAVAYTLWSSGLTVDQVEQIVGSLVPINK